MVTSFIVIEGGDWKGIETVNLVVWFTIAKGERRDYDCLF